MLWDEWICSEDFTLQFVCGDTCEQGRNLPGAWWWNQMLTVEYISQIVREEAQKGLEPGFHPGYISNYWIKEKSWRSNSRNIPIKLLLLFLVSL